MNCVKQFAAVSHHNQRGIKQQHLLVKCRSDVKLNHRFLIYLYRGNRAQNLLPERVIGFRRSRPGKVHAKLIAMREGAHTHRTLDLGHVEAFGYLSARQDGVTSAAAEKMQQRKFHAWSRYCQEGKLEGWYLHYLPPKAYNHSIFIASTGTN